MKVSDIINKFLSKKHERKKKKTLKQISTKTRIQKRKSRKNEILDKIFQKKTDDHAVIDQVLLENDVQLDDESRNFYYNLSKLRSDYNKKLTLPTGLVSGDIVLYESYNLTTNIVNNDKLINTFIFNKKISDTTSEDLLKISELSKVTICSDEPIIYSEDDLNVNEFYIEDFSKKFSFVTSDNPIKNAKSYMDKNVDFTARFKIGNVGYIGKADKEYILVYDNVMGAEKVDNLMKQQKFIRKDKGELKIGLKKIKKGTGLFYFQQTFPVTDFSPSFLMFNDSYKFQVMIKIKINPEDFFNYLYDNVKNSTYDNLKLGPEFINIYNIDNVIVMIYLISFLVPNVDQGFKKVYESYDKCRENLFYIKQDYQLFRQLCLSFYDNFSSRLNLDRIASVYTLCNNYLTKQEAWSRYYKDGDLANLVEFINRFGGVLANFLKLDKVNVAKQIQLCCEAILNTRMNQGTNLEAIVRQVGTTVYSLTLANYGTACLLDMRSQYGFLTNLYGDNPKNVNVNVNINDMLRRIGANDNQNAMENLMDAEKNEPENIRINTMLDTFVKACENTIGGFFNPDDVVKNMNVLIKQIRENDKNNTIGIKEINPDDVYKNIDATMTKLIDSYKNLNRNDMVENINKNKKIIETSIKVLLVLILLCKYCGEAYFKLGNNEQQIFYQNVSNLVNEYLLPQDGNYNELIKYVDSIWKNPSMCVFEYIKNNYLAKLKQEEEKQKAQAQAQQQESTWGKDQGGNKGNW